jgi:hypothetical protein
VRKALFEAIEATTERWITCSHCKHRLPVDVPDNNARIRAMQLAVELGFGRAPTDEKPVPQRSTACSRSDPDTILT